MNVAFLSHTHFFFIRSLVYNTIFRVENSTGTDQIALVGAVHFNLHCFSGPFSLVTNDHNF